MSGVRVTVYLNKVIADAIKEAYPEARTLGEALQLFIYEVLAGTIENRSFDEKAIEMAEALVRLKKTRLKYGR